MRISERSFLFVPGDRPERFNKALGSGADAIIIDLEDAIKPESKAIARENALAFFASGKRAFVRMNAQNTPWYDADLDVLRQDNCLGVLLPKAEDAEAVSQLTDEKKPVLPIVETARGMANIRRIAAVGGVQRLVFGTLDFSLDTSIADDDAMLVAIRTEFVLASRIADISPPVDGVTTEYVTNIRTETSARHARRMGFGGKLCIHPSQIAFVNPVFSYSDEEIQWAREIVGLGASCRGAVSHNGRMVDKPVLDKARKILACPTGNGI